MTERESNSRRREVADLLVLPRPAKTLQNGAGFSEKCLPGVLKTKEWLHCKREKEREREREREREQLASTQKPPLPKGKGTGPFVQSTRS